MLEFMHTFLQVTGGLLAAMFITVLAPGCDHDTEAVELSNEEFAAALEVADDVQVEPAATRLVRTDEAISKQSTAEVWIEYEEKGQRRIAGGTITCEGSCSGLGCGVAGCDPKSDGTCSGTVCKSSGQPCTNPSCKKISSGTIAPDAPGGPTPAGPGPG